MLSGTPPYLVLYNFTENVACAFVLWFAVDVFHVLKSGLGDVDRHGGDGCDQAREHGGHEVAEDSVLK